MPTFLRTFIIQPKNALPMFRSEHHRALFRQALQMLEGKTVWLTLTTKEPKRTEKQNAYYWVYLSLLAEVTGHSKDELHAWAKSKFLSTARSEVFGENIALEKSTTSLSKNDFTEYIMKIEAETGIIAPDPTPFQLPQTFEEWEEARELQLKSYLGNEDKKAS